MHNLTHRTIHTPIQIFEGRKKILYTEHGGRMHSRLWQVSVAGGRGQRQGRCCRWRRQWRHAVAGDTARGRGGIPCPGVKSRHSRTGSCGEILCRVERGVPCCHAVCLAANIVSDGRLKHLTFSARNARLCCWPHAAWRIARRRSTRLRAR